MTARKHVFKDLRPYVCTSEHCLKAAQLFECRNDWYDHEVQFHRREWYCDDCKESFRTKGDSKDHLKTDHENLLSESELTAATNRCEKASFDDQPCPICQGTQKYSHTRLRSHLARHMQQLALFTLPSLSGGTADEVKSNGADMEGGDSVGLSEHSNLSFDSNPYPSSEGGQPQPNIAEKIQFYNDVLREGSREPAPVNPAACVCTKCKEDLKKLLVRIKNNHDDQFPRKVYPKRDVYNLLTADVLKSLLRCPCSNCRCDGSLPPPQDEIVDITTSQYRLILAILLVMDKVYLLQGFVDENYTDERVLQEPPSPEDLEDLAVRFFSQWKIPTRFHDPHFQSEFHFDFQPQFILPDLPGTALFTSKCNLPLDLGELIGSGGYGDVFKARILDGYHSFETEVCLFLHT